MEGDLTWGGKHAIQYRDNVLQNCTLEFYVSALKIRNRGKLNVLSEHKSTLNSIWHALREAKVNHKMNCK